ncbi:MAG: hypothetical protein ACOZIN_06075 [Myxococcota bacterium]
MAVAASPACKWQTRAEVDREWLDEVTGSFELPEEDLSGRPPRVYRLRVYADQKYRAHEALWKERFAEVIDKVNTITRSWFAVEFQVVEVVEWVRQLNESEMSVLGREANRSGVDWVVGLLGPDPMGEADGGLFVGQSQYFGDMLLVRTSLNPHIYRSWRDAMALETTEVRRAYARYIVLNEARVFLHEWGHSLGIPHVVDQACVMHLTNHNVVRFSAPVAQLIRLGLERRDEGLRDSTARAEWTTDAVALVQDHSSSFVHEDFCEVNKYAKQLAQAEFERTEIWHEIVTRNFVLRAELDSTQARELAIRIEMERRAFERILGADWLSPLIVFVPGPKALARLQFEGFNDLVIHIHGRWLVIARVTPDSEESLHDRVHRMLASAVLGRSLSLHRAWLYQGMARYLAGIEVDPVGGTLGTGNLDAWRQSLGTQRMPIATLWDWQGESGPDGRRSALASSFVAIHCLLERRPDVFRRFLGAILPPGDERAVWSTLFGAVPHVGLEREIDQCARSVGSPTSATVEIPRFDEPRVASRAETYANRALLLAYFRQRDKAIAEARRALRFDSTVLEAEWVLAFLEKTVDERLRLAKELVARYPGNVQAWSLLGETAMESSEESADVKSIVERSLKEAPVDPMLFDKAAKYHLKRGNAKRALELSARALAGWPSSALYVRTHAAAWKAVGSCDEALRYQRIAVERMAARGHPKDVMSEEAARVEEYTACAARAVADGGPVDGGRR